MWEHLANVKCASQVKSPFNAAWHAQECYLFLSEKCQLLGVIQKCVKISGDRSFPAAAARAWNTLPQVVQDAPSLPVFLRELKTVLFQSSFPAD